MDFIDNLSEIINLLITALLAMLSVHPAWLKKRPRKRIPPEAGFAELLSVS
jgi:hypothetical protein